MFNLFMQENIFVQIWDIFEILGIKYIFYVNSAAHDRIKTESMCNNGY